MNYHLAASLRVGTVAITFKLGQDGNILPWSFPMSKLSFLPALVFLLAAVPAIADVNQVSAIIAKAYPYMQKLCRDALGGSGRAYEQCLRDEVYGAEQLFSGKLQRAQKDRPAYVKACIDTLPPSFFILNACLDGHVSPK
jgi:hypothetical protein